MPELHSCPLPLLFLSPPISGGTDRADPAPSGRLIKSMRRECSRNVAHSSHAFVVAWLLWTPKRCCWPKLTHTTHTQLSNQDHVFSSKVQNCHDKHTLTISSHIWVVTLFGLSVCDLQVAVTGSELLPLHDLDLQVPQRDVWPVKKHRVVAEFGGKFIMNMSHGGINQKQSPTLRENIQLTAFLSPGRCCYGTTKLAG